MAGGEKAVLAVSRESGADTESSGLRFGSLEALKREFTGCEESSPHLTLKRFRAFLERFKPLAKGGETSLKPYCFALIRTNALLVGRLVRGRA